MLYQTYYEFKNYTFSLSADDNFLLELRLDKLPLEAPGMNKILMETIKQLDEYFSGNRKEFSIPIKQAGTPFQKTVWTKLQKIPYGKTISYKELAGITGNSKASRAVGMANNKNPIAIIVPCHRVIGTDGKLIGYAGGLKLKKELIELEKNNANN